MNKIASKFRATTQEQRYKIVPKKKKEEEEGGDLLVWRATSVLDWEDSEL